MKSTPTRIDSHTPTELFIEWNEGAQFAIPYVEIRFFCPCASCIDEHTGQRTLQKSTIDPEIRPESVQLVGKYAIQINWSDGHATGMYHFDRLLELCQKQGRKLN